MKAKELRSMTVEDLNEQLKESLHKAFNLRMSNGFNPKEIKTSDFRRVRRGIARIKTILSQKAKS